MLYVGENITVSDEFGFQQKNVQKHGGWCAGISLGLIAFMRNRAASGAVTVHGAMNAAQDFCKALTITFDPEKRKSTETGDMFRNEVWTLQEPYSNAVLSYWRAGGSYETAFAHTHEPIIAMLKLNVDDGYSRTYGSQFGSGGDNHAGVMVLTPPLCFLFDPNCGGVVFGYGGVGSIPEMVDQVLGCMYRKYDRMNGARLPALVYAQKVDTDYVKMDFRNIHYLSGVADLGIAS